MDRNAIIATLQSRQTELKALGAVSLSLFGSAARGEATGSDIDLAITLDPATTPRGSYYFGRLEELRKRLEPCSGSLDKPRVQQEIDRDRVRAF